MKKSRTNVLPCLLLIEILILCSQISVASVYTLHPESTSELYSHGEWLQSNNSQRIVPCETALKHVPDIKVGLRDAEVLELLGEPKERLENAWVYNFMACVTPPKAGEQKVLGLGIVFDEGTVKKIEYATVDATGPAPIPIKKKEQPELFTKVERVFHDKEPKWKVESIRVTDTSDPLQQSIVFRFGKNQASVEITIWKREQDAQDVFVAHSLAFDSTKGKKAVERELQNLGDENHIWTNPRSVAWPMIMFRKASINVTVFAPSVQIAKRFAQHVIEQIKSS